MLATLGRPPTRFDQFAIEAKYDGQRGIAILDGDRVTLLSRNGADITRTFPEISVALPTALSRPVVLDGEIVAFDAQGVPSFARLQQRWPQSRRPSAELLRAVPVRFFAFDVLNHDGQDITKRSYASAVSSSPTSPPTPEALLSSFLRTGLARTRQRSRCLHGDGTRRHRQQAPGLAVPAGRAVPGLDQDVPPAAERVRHRWVAAR